jgi:hypothetical protein
MLSADMSADGCPGLIISTKHLLEQNHSVAKSVDGMLPKAYPQQFPALYVTPTETSSLFSNTQELALLKSVASLVASQVHPNLKFGVDAIWLVYGAAQLHDEWTKPGADLGACAFKLASLGLSTASLVGRLSPDLELPDSWSNGINFCLKSGEAIYKGKTPPINELTIAADKRMDIPLKLLKLAGISLDPEPANSISGLSPVASVTLLAPNSSAGK